MHLDDTDTTELLSLSAAGDHVAFAHLYDLTSARVYGLALRVLKDRHHAEEVVQESYLRFWQQADDYDPARGSVVNWMLTITHRRSVDRVRSEELHRRRAAGYSSASAAVPQPPVDETVVDHDDTQALNRCLRRLTALQRSTIEMSYFDGMTYPEVAATTSTPLPTIKSRIRDGLRSLRDCVKGGASC